ncbi:nucleotidyltransferase [Mycolicibacterium sp. P1-18]|uniref:nucleotidyltransferase domain-containing protein n=1 Tax=Mycolicibacterium sp. P1-18 TaxID=2024615 RepID=UPI001F5B2934|nr:nucleotidyltransferase [Mycolicibacterium sp. P1-18]
MEQMLSMLLDGAVETLDIPPHLQALAITSYEEVGNWLAEHGGYGCRVYPQGSFRLGTVVRPHTLTGDFDIDLVFLLFIAKEATTQAFLKQDVGDLLQKYLDWKERNGPAGGLQSCEPRRRCWTLHDPVNGFHLDVLPAIPDVDYLPSGILLTDKELFYWQHSDPIGYAKWFRKRSLELQNKAITAAAQRGVDVEDVPIWEFRTTLQRIVQVLKWHCMLFFADDPDNRPPSILITTLAATAYRGETDLFTATRNALAGMNRHVEDRNGVAWVANPAHGGENFVDKWAEYPERRQAYYAWHQDLSNTLNDALSLRGKGLQTVASRLAQSFGAEPIKQSTLKYGTQMRGHTSDGTLRLGNTGLLSPTAAGIAVPRHNFYGQHPRPSD